MIEFWVFALALTIFLYVLLDGMDLGVGILFGFARSEEAKTVMIRSISPIWDGNETWLVLSAAILFGAFPLVYSLVLSAFYLPLMLLLCGLILRGIAFEFRARSKRFKPLWGFGFFSGSAVAAFVQGAAVGAMVIGLPNQAGRFTGGPMFWVAPFPILCGIGLCLGYALAGAAWLVKKTDGPVREKAYDQIGKLLIAVTVFLIAAFVFALRLELPVMMRWSERPLLAIFPVIGAIGFLLIAVGLVGRRDNLPFRGCVLMFVAAFGTLAASFLPYMIPFTITYTEAAAPQSSLAFLFWFAGIVVLPLTLLYTAVNYRVFRGKISSDDRYA